MSSTSPKHSSRDLRSTRRSEEHTSELQSRQYLHSFPTRRSSDRREIDVVVALNRLIEEREPDEQPQPQTQQQGFAVYAGFHRNTGLRAAGTSSPRLVRVL